MNEARLWDLNDAIEIKIKNKDDFLVIAETLERIGIPNNKTKKLYQTAHILHKRGKYYITHFKLLFSLDGKKSVFEIDDKARQDKIAKMMEDWGLCEIITPMNLKTDVNQIKILKHSEKKDWTLVKKYNIGNN